MAATKIHKVLKLIGRWNGPDCEDLADLEPDPEYPDENRFILPQDLVDPLWEPVDRNAIVVYLRTAPVIQQMLDHDWCRFRCGVGTWAMRDRSDGDWTWPEGLAHCIEKHLIRLPAEFVSHIRSRRFQPPLEVWFRDPEIRSKYSFEWDTKFWEDWCKSQRKT